jgi:hypothetical protein
VKKPLIIGASACLIALAIGWAFKLWKPGYEKPQSALPPHSFYPLTLTASDARIPCFQAEIEGIPFLLDLDLGYTGVLSLPKHLLEQLTLKPDAETVLFGSIRGNKYESPLFTIPRLTIEDLAFVNLPAKENSLEFERDCTLRTKKELGPSDIRAYIGWRAFAGGVTLIDLSKDIAICCDSLETLKENGYSLEQFIPIKLPSDKQLIELEANIDNRKVKCMLDTGCTFNLIHTPSTDEELEFGKVDFDNPLPSTMLIVGEHRLGPCTFYKTQLPFGIEAILGVDFLETQVICIDLVNDMLYLHPVPEDTS